LGNRRNSDEPRAMKNCAERKKGPKVDGLAGEDGAPHGTEIKRAKIKKGKNKTWGVKPQKKRVACRQYRQTCQVWTKGRLQ